MGFYDCLGRLLFMVIGKMKGKLEGKKEGGER
jgi:hypothetical protein